MFSLKEMLKRTTSGAKRPAGADDPATGIPLAEHGIAKSALGKNALQVIQTLLEAGHQAYLVGGGIRDLLLDLRPKDFDVSTSARPEDVVKLFRRSRLIGRRFKIVHVYFGREVIEVTTFRGQHPDEDQSHPHAVRSETGQLLRDNIYGTLEEDALRRDFSANSLYYDISNETILDYTDGYADIEARRLKMVGNPVERFKEDPVRLLRAVRFSAKLGFTIDPDTERPITGLSDQLQHIPAARLFDEALKLLLSGHGAASFVLLKKYRLFQQLFPQTAATLDPDSDEFIRQALLNTDERLARNQGITPAFFFAVVLWPPLQRTLESLGETGTPTTAGMQRAGDEVISQQVQRTAIPRRFSCPMREIWELQIRLPRRQGQRASKLLSHPRFRAAYDFLLLREQCGEQTDGLGKWWTDFQEADANQRTRMVGALGHGKPRRRRRNRRKPKPASH